MRDLFEPISRDERQAQSVQKWLNSKGRGTLECCTGYGKTRCAFIIIKKILSRYPSIRIWVVVPTDLLKKQWEKLIEENSLQLNVEVLIINTASKNIAFSLEVLHSIICSNAFHPYFKIAL